MAAVPLLALLALFAAAFAAPFAKAVPSEAPQATWITDGTVKATAKSGNTLYLGGKFGVVAPATGPAAAFDATSAELSSAALISDSFADEVEVVEADGEGGYYAGGRFGHAGGVAHSSLVHVKADGSIDHAFAPQIDESVFAIALDGSTLYIGGKIQEVDGETRYAIAALDAESGEVLSWAPEIWDSAFSTDYVYGLAVHGGHVYVAGDFGKIDGESRSRLASINAVGTAGEGEVTEWQPAPEGNIPLALAVSGSTLYAAGKFNKMDEDERKYVAAFDLSAGEPGEPPLTTWEPAAPNTYVLSVAVSDDGETVYLGGEFSQVNGETRQHLAALSAADGSLDGEWTPETNNKVRDVAVSGSTVYAGGDFNQVDGESRRGVVAFDAEGEGSLQAWDPGALGTVHSVAVSGSDVVAGGYFSGAGGVPRTNLAAIDLTTGEPTAWAPEANKEVLALALSEDEELVYVGGQFTELNGEAHARLAAVKAADGQPTAWNPNAANAVEAIAIDGTRMYAGGGFPELEGSNQYKQLAAFDLEGEGATLDTTWKPKPNNDVKTLKVSGGLLYAGGNFTEIGGQIRNRIAAFKTVDGEVLEGWEPEINSKVNDLIVSGSKVYAGGQFSTVNGEAHSRIVEIDSEGNPTSWSAELDTEVNALATDGTAIYAGGTFQKTNGSYAYKRLVAFDDEGELLDWYPGARSTVYSLEYKDATLIAGGGFNSLEYGPQASFAAFAAPVLSVVKSGEGSGEVSSSPAAIECGSTCSSEFAAGEEVTLTAAPEAGSEFTGWSGGGCTGTEPCVVTLNADASVTAVFAVSSEPKGGEGGEGSGAGGSGAAGGGAGDSAAGAGPGAGSAGAAGTAWVHAKIKKAKIKHTGNRAGFWFATKGTEGAKRLYCSLVKKPTGKNARKQVKRTKVRFKPCGPRKRIYRNLKPGRYVFRVRAVGDIAWDRKPARRIFRIH